MANSSLISKKYLQVDDEIVDPLDLEESVCTQEASSKPDVQPPNTNNPVKKGRRNIVRPKTEHEIEAATREATTKERKRLERLKKSQLLLDEVQKNYPQDFILDVNPKTKEVRVKVHNDFIKDLKAHQKKGIEFMFSNCVGNIDNLDESANGCVLAHCMGLGKTFQVIVFIHTLLANNYLKNHFKRILIAAPVNTLKNWFHEFQKWLPRQEKYKIKFYTVYNCSKVARARKLSDWFLNGGVCIIGYHAFMSSLKNDAKSKSMSKSLENVTKALLDPGPDLMVIDEGHQLKSDKSQLCQVFQKVATPRKIILTGTPLQNNLNEFYTMIDLIKPHLLGSKKEFDNRFKNPIDNGLHTDSNVSDIQQMKTRIAILNRLLSGSVQRYDYDELTPYLKEKYEYVVFVRASDLIIKMYNYYLDNQSCKSTKYLLSDSILLRLICSHPEILPLRYEKEKRIQAAREEATRRKNAAGAKHIQSQLKLGNDIHDDPEDDFVIVLDHIGKKGENNPSPASSSTENSLIPVNTSNVTSEPSNNQNVAESSSSRGKGTETNDRHHWFWQFVNSSQEFKRIELSSKFMVLFFILERCIALEEKLVVVSQCLETLDLIESYLQTHKKFSINSEDTIEIEWKRDTNYFRIDGTVSIDKRTESVSAFNNSENKTAKLFLLATKAGGLGINLIGANRCIMFDCHWNPMVDMQAIFRVYRLGQTKPVYIYRLITKGTMEEKIYNMQVLKTGLSIRVVDKTNIKNAVSKADVHEYYSIRPQREYESNMRPPTDKLLGDLILKHKDIIVDYHEHDSLLQRRPEDDIRPQEIELAWEAYQRERDEEKRRIEEEKRRKEEEKRQTEEEKRRIEETLRAGERRQPEQSIKAQPRVQTRPAIIRKTDEKLKQTTGARPREWQIHNYAKQQESAFNEVSQVVPLGNEVQFIEAREMNALQGICVQFPFQTGAQTTGDHLPLDFSLGPPQTTVSTPSDSIEPSINGLTNDQYVCYLRDLDLNNSASMSFPDNNQYSSSDPNMRKYVNNLRANFFELNDLVSNSINNIRSSNI